MNFNCTGVDQRAHNKAVQLDKERGVMLNRATLKTITS